MKLRRPRLILVPALVGLLASCADPVVRPPADDNGDRGPSVEALGRLEAEINRYRRSVGKEPVTRHAGLDAMALHHCKFMALNPRRFQLGSTIISHYGFEDRVLRAQRQYGMLSLAENVAGGPHTLDTARRFVRARAASSGHDFNLRQDWDFVGIAVHITPGDIAYAVQLFATRPHSHFRTDDRMRGG